MTSDSPRRPSPLGAPTAPPKGRRRVLGGEFRKGFGRYLSTRKISSGHRGLFLALMRNPRNADERVDVFRWIDDEPVWPTSEEELVANLTREGVAPLLLEAGRSFWQDFRLSTMTPDERRQEKARLTGERAREAYLDRLQKAREMRAGMRAGTGERAAEWARAGRMALDMPVPLRRLVAPDEAEAIDPGVMALRNRVSGREFLHEVLGLTDLDIRRERFTVIAAIDAISGWTRLSGPQRHRGQIQLVYQRDGTNGRPTVLQEAPRPPRRRVV